MTSSKNAIQALKKFSNMYRHVTSKYSTEEEYHIVANYGTFMLEQFSDFFSDHVEIPGKVRALRQAENREGNKEII